jgi:hypothetical protein
MSCKVSLVLPGKLSRWNLEVGQASIGLTPVYNETSVETLNAFSISCSVIEQFVIK